MVQVSLTGLVYFGVFLGLYGSGLYTTEPGEPAYMLAVMVLVLPATVGLLFRTSRPFRRWILRADLVEYVGLQTFRVIGATFLFLMGLGYLPPGFALPAGWGDVLVGLIALIAVVRLSRRQELPAGLFWLLFVLGLLDFVGAFGSGNIVSLSGNWSEEYRRMTEWPLLLVPGFLVPMWVVTHFYALFKFGANDTSNSRVGE